MLTLVKICACSAAAVALSSPAPIDTPASASEVADAPTSAMLDLSSPTDGMTQPTCQQCNLWSALAAAR